LIEPGKPWQNGVAESFNGKFRDECLSLEWFRSRARMATPLQRGAPSRSQPTQRGGGAVSSRIRKGAARTVAGFPECVRSGNAGHPSGVLVRGARCRDTAQTSRGKTEASHRATVLLHASFGPRLATTPLLFATPSPPSGWIEDFHLQAVVHARYTKQKPRQRRGFQLI
jgi:hypothetical protein